MATFNVVEFPGQGTAHPITVEGATAKVRDLLAKAEIAYDPNGKRELRVNGDLTKDVDMEVSDGASITVTDRIEAG